MPFVFEFSDVHNYHPRSFCGGRHTIEFVSRVCDGDFSTWTYNITSGSSPSIGHWIIAWCGGSASIINASHPNDVVYGTDPTTGVHGIKFDVGLEDGESAIFWFTLDKCYEASDVEVVIKAGTSTPHSDVTGPIFSYSLNLTVEGEGPDSTYMKAVAETDYALINTVTFYWYGSFESDGEAGPVGDPVYIAVDSDGSDGFEAHHQVTEDDLGYWYVKAEFEGGFHPGEASGILSLADVFPWFADLPLALLATVGAVFILRKKGHMSLPHLTSFLVSSFYDLRCE